ncbi:hypothetical protein Dehly_0062 [Dehalogenimonas lykanthroporepellens BL-DC-9]|jgi:hypothetical protein|nr:hypothetical protein Dehly_0062 [Dehalogenimonas lykanthroporepellens BL-DC-9]
MEHKQAAEILLKLAEKQVISPEEKEAVMIAVGVLGWTSLAQGRTRNLRKNPGKPPPGK